ncbi:unnamed protein product [Nippostrongylus brasiliensis]|uniref:Protein kinase domain-containing protein n=1 Tax=Nippostrongylus brasiliensis TaxID=27835 RepID=A0A0N4XMP6_NIPBR|nr:unnamed protein product [Nippostrongylus brasiliensis]
MDYAIQSIMKSKACATYHKDIASLRQALEKAWEEIDEEVLRAAVEAFPKRLKAVERWTIEKKLGEGGFGAVYRCRDGTGQYALKVEGVAEQIQVRLNPILLC